MLKSILYLVLVTSLSVTSCLLYAQSAVPKDSAGNTAAPPAAEKSAKTTATQPPQPPTSSRPTVKLSPGVRALEQKRQILTIPAEAIQHFLNRPKIFTPDEIEGSGYVVANANQTILATTGDKIYAMGLDASVKYKDYMIVAVGTAYRNPAAEEILAYEAIPLGDATLEKPGDAEGPAVLRVTNARREIVKGARLIPLTEQHATEDFYPHSPEKLEDAYIVGVVDNLSQIGQYQIVVINKGSDDKLERGHVLAVYPNQTETRDAVGNEKKMVTLPAIQVGTLLVFKVFENVSYALVTKATKQFQLYDKVTIH